MIADRQKKSIQALDDKPVLPQDLNWYVSSYSILSSRRQYGMSSPQPISMSDIVSYLTIYPWHDVDTFVKYIIVLDNTFLEYKNEEYGRRNNKNSS